MALDRGTYYMRQTANSTETKKSTSELSKASISRQIHCTIHQIPHNANCQGQTSYDLLFHSAFSKQYHDIYGATKEIIGRAVVVVVVTKARGIEVAGEVDSNSVGEDIEKASQSFLLSCCNLLDKPINLPLQNHFLTDPDFGNRCVIHIEELLEAGNTLYK
ncbi:hypothetical protein SLE2022_372130 [Rubroshorea leprosula]